ncbi:MAG TPA: zinc ribbon domain-containing protein, partial [Spirochaetota bacterium]|nr:zinc ribbon domain-containing protein [Spirochaetota bacterium]
IEENEIEDLEIPVNIKEALINNSITAIEQLIELSFEDMKALEGFNDEMADYLKNFVDDNFEVIVEEDDMEKVAENATVEDGVLYYQCPNCGANITEDETSCKSCGVEIVFEEEEEEEEVDEETISEEV